MNKREWLRQELPYGIRSFADGTSELFNRKYEAISDRKRLKGQPWMRILDRNGLIPTRISNQSSYPCAVEESWFYNDGKTPWSNSSVRRACEDILDQWHLC